MRPSRWGGFEPRSPCYESMCINHCAAATTANKIINQELQNNQSMFRLKIVCNEFQICNSTLDLKNDLACRYPNKQSENDYQRQGGNSQYFNKPRTLYGGFPSRHSFVSIDPNRQRLEVTK